jgi:hypothetical protein
MTDGFQLTHEADTSYFEINSPIAKDKSRLLLLHEGVDIRLPSTPASEFKKQKDPISSHCSTTPPQKSQSPIREIVGFSFKRKQIKHTLCDSPSLLIPLRQRLNFEQKNLDEI